MSLTHVFVGVLFIVVGILTYIFRNTPNPYIGIRLGYTYFSKEAWRKANTFAAFYCILFGFFLLFIALTIQLSDTIFVLLMLAGVLPMVAATYRMAKESYEMEDMCTPMEGAKPLEKIDIKPYLAVQIVLITIYLLVAFICWDKLPETVATHFDFYGNANSFMDRFNGTITLPLAAMCIIPFITALATKEPMFIRFPVSKGQKHLFALLTSLQIFVFAVMVVVLLYNAGLIALKLWFPLVVFGFVAFLLVWIRWMWRRYSAPF